MCTHVPSDDAGDSDVIITSENVRYDGSDTIMVYDDLMDTVSKKLLDRFESSLRTGEILKPIELQCFANVEALLVSLGEGMNGVVQGVDEASVKTAHENPWVLESWHAKLSIRQVSEKSVS